MLTVNRESNTYLSKSLFIKGLQCHKSLYLHKCHPELKDEITEAQEARFQMGFDVGTYARKLFPGGVEIVFDDASLSAQIDKTEKEIRRGTRILYEPAFTYDDIFVKADILCKNEEGWEIYEVKGSLKVKDVHYDDVAVQYYALKGSGLPVSKAFIIHINSGYVRHGEIEVDKLFTITDVTNAVIEKQDYVRDEIERMREMLGRDIPDIDIGSHCSDPYECDFQGHCWQHIPEDSIFSLRGGGIDKFDFYRKGIIRLRDVPVEILPKNQRIQWEGVIERKSVTNKTGIKEFLDSLWYPQCFLDFETIFMSPIPLFDGTRPYQQVPFQYSLHCLKEEKGKLAHYEYLGAANIDPRKELLEKLLSEIPKHVCVLVYNRSFETKILKEFKGWFPEYADQIENIIGNIRDLMIPFQRKDLYRPEMEGSYSIKKVLPALTPELSYDGLEVSDGATASNAYLATWESEDPAGVERIRKALLEYCKMDTIGMVRILEELREVCFRELNI